MAGLTHGNTSGKCVSCCMIDRDQRPCGTDSNNVQFYHVSQLDKDIVKDEQFIATELELLASRCGRKETEIEWICPEHLIYYSWKKDEKYCQICKDASRTKPVRAGRSASIEIRNLQHFLNFPILGYVCDECRQTLSIKYHIDGQLNQYGLWEIQSSSPVQKNSSTTSTKNEEHDKNTLNATRKQRKRHVWILKKCYSPEIKGQSRSTEYHTSLQHSSYVTRPGTQGLHNLGNTCFMNSVLQCLVHVPELICLFLNPNWRDSLDRTNPRGSGGQVAQAFARLVESMSLSNSSTRTVSPREFKYSIANFNQTFDGYNQQDPFQLLNSVLDALHEDLKKHRRRELPPIAKLFHGYTISIIKCLSCNHAHEPDPELFSSLSLNIPNTTESSTLQQCFQDMSAIHYQTDDSEWYCSQCREYSKSTTQTFLQNLPPILIIHFKRFNYDPRSYKHIDTFIHYPLILEFEKLTEQGSSIASYELIGVCLKLGSLLGGHAYAYARLETGEWCCFNDSSVSPIDVEHVISKHAYILTYRQRQF